jgi:sec-independent protein translocase protein TatC
MVVDTEAERPDADQEEEGGPVKSFLEHLEDLRWVLIKSVVSLGVAILICLLGGNYVVEIIKYPLKRANISYPKENQVITVFYATNRLGVFNLGPKQREKFEIGTNQFVAIRIKPILIGTNQVLSWDIDPDPALGEQTRHLSTELINLGPASGFFVAFQVAMYAGMVLASPLIFYFVISFVFPALRMKERYYVHRALFFGLGLFLTGVAFCYFILMPAALVASQKYSEWLGFSAAQWRADEYISFVCKFMLGMGLGFEMPVVILTLVKLGILNYSILSRARPYMIVINLVLGAVLTTPEVITQILMAIPLQLLFEISVWIAWYWERKEKKAAAAAGES